jgi:hypothetical protein
MDCNVNGTGHWAFYGKINSIMTITFIASRQHISLDVCRSYENMWTEDG